MRHYSRLQGIQIKTAGICLMELTPLPAGAGGHAIGVHMPGGRGAAGCGVAELEFAQIGQLGCACVLPQNWGSMLPAAAALRTGRAS